MNKRIENQDGALDGAVDNGTPETVTVVLKGLVSEKGNDNFRSFVVCPELKIGSRYDKRSNAEFEKASTQGLVTTMSYEAAIKFFEACKSAYHTGKDSQVKKWDGIVARLLGGSVGGGVIAPTFI